MPEAPMAAAEQCFVHGGDVGTRPHACTVDRACRADRHRERFARCRTDIDPAHRPRRDLRGSRGGTPGAAATHDGRSGSATHPAIATVAARRTTGALEHGAARPDDRDVRFWVVGLAQRTSDANPVARAVGSGAGRLSRRPRVSTAPTPSVIAGAMTIRSAQTGNHVVSSVIDELGFAESRMRRSAAALTS